MDRAIAESREDLEQERDKRYALIHSVRKHRKDRETDRAKDRAYYALTQLRVEREVRFLVDDLYTACREITQLSGEVS